MFRRNVDPTPSAAFLDCRPDDGVPSGAMSRRRFPLLVLAVDLDVLFLFPACHPVLGIRAWAVLMAALAAVNLALLFGLRLGLERLDRAFRSSALATNLTLALSSLVVATGAAELLAWGLVGAGIVEAYSPMRTVAGGGEDWRLAHITADKYREADPVLLWRPVDRWPYTSQRFKGPEVEMKKPAGTFRILAYGDSNTDGPPRGGWPEQLQDVLDESYPSGPAFEVLNAGVAGYSSHQGLARFRQEAKRFRPDLVLVSFGWNDAVSTSTPDEAYRPPSAGMVALERTLLRYFFYRVARHLLGDRPPAESKAAGVPRVSRTAYLANMRAFRKTARRTGAAIAFLTRPHAEIPPTRTWRGSVPRYNRALLAFGRRSGAAVIDVDGAFAGRPDVFVDECHFTPEGHGEMARLLHRSLIERGLLPSPEG